MAKDSVPPDVWFKNFQTGVGILIDEELAKGNTITKIALSRTLHDKCCAIAGYEVTDILGYVVEIVDTGYEDDEIMIIGSMLN